MAFRKFARASIIKPDIHLDSWAEVRQAGVQGPTFTQREATKVVLQEYNPDEFLLTHCTIIASVDTENASDPLGKHMVDGFEVNRKYADYLITPETTKFINNNQDAWEKKLLLASFRTFVGGENYVEHVQIPELSKGKIIDAAARDIGDSIYVDILVATERKHAPLISAITSGQLQTLSMGCQVEFTTCTKCGNVAYDETQLCTHIRFFKGNEYIDGVGKKRKIAEICGHISEEPGSVKFIEASWVASPAFPGAVLRNILSPSEVQGVGKRMQVAFSQSPRVTDPRLIQKAARQLFGFGQEEQLPAADPSASPPAEDVKSDPLAKAVDSVADIIRERALEKVRGEVRKDDFKGLDENLNDTLVKQALHHASWRKIAHVLLNRLKSPTHTKKMLLGMVLYKQGGWKNVQASKSFKGAEILALVRLFETSTRKASRAGNGRTYKTVLAVGGVTQYADEVTYLAACRRVLGRDITDSEKIDLLEKGYLYSLGS